MQESDVRRIMGIDPGLASTGVGIIEVIGPGQYRCVHSEFTTTAKAEQIPARLERIHAMVRRNIDLYRPAVVAVESIFFAKNVRSAVLMAHGRGAAILAVCQAGITLREYSPLEIKQSVVGKGRAGKEQVQQMVGMLLGLKETPTSDHETDALACALCHAFRAEAQSRFLRAASGGEVTHGAPSLAEKNRELLSQMRTGRRRRRFSP